MRHSRSRNAIALACVIGGTVLGASVAAAASPLPAHVYAPYSSAWLAIGRGVHGVPSGAGRHAAPGAAGIARLRHGHALRLALTFAAFQAAMPLIGWAVGQRFATVIQSVDHWIAFVLLGVIGARMIYADLRPAEPGAVAPGRGWRTLLVLAVATSIDALVVGFGLTFVGSILGLVVIVGLVTFAMCLTSVHLGHRFRRVAEGKVQAIGGLILIGIGTKILVEHLGLLNWRIKQARRST